MTDRSAEPVATVVNEMRVWPKTVLPTGTRYHIVPIAWMRHMLLKDFQLPKVNLSMFTLVSAAACCADLFGSGNVLDSAFLFTFLGHCLVIHYKDCKTPKIFSWEKVS